MGIFAKLYQFDSVGQVLVKLDDEENGPEVRLYFQPEGLGVCSSAFNFKADENGSEWDKAEQAFELVDAEKAEKIVLGVLETLPKGLTDPEGE